MSKILAFTAPILEDKFAQWEKFSNKLKNEYRKEFNETRKNAGIHERTYLQRTPGGDFVIVTLEGSDPLAAYGSIFTKQDSFTKWFVQEVKDIHGVDLTQPMDGMAPQLIVDSTNA